MAKEYVSLLVSGTAAGELESGFYMSVPALAIDLYRSIHNTSFSDAAFLVAEALRFWSDDQKHLILLLSGSDIDSFREILAILFEKPLPQISLRIYNINSKSQWDNVFYIIQNYPAVTGIELVVGHIHLLGILDKLCQKNHLLRAITVESLGIVNSLPSTEQSYSKLLAAKEEIVSYCRTYGLAAIDSTYINYMNTEKLKADCIRSRDQGFIGRTLVYPSQIKTCISIYAGG